MPTTLTSTVDGTQFALDGCFGEFWANDKIYTRLLTEPVSALLDGYNLTLFAYGQVGRMCVQWGPQHRGPPRRRALARRIPCWATALSTGYCN